MVQGMFWKFLWVFWRPEGQRNHGQIGCGLSAAIKNCPQAARRVPVSGHRNCPRGQAAWPPAGTDLAVHGQFHMAANSGFRAWLLQLPLLHLRCQPEAAPDQQGVSDMAGQPATFGRQALEAELIRRRGSVEIWCRRASGPHCNQLPPAPYQSRTTGAVTFTGDAV